MVKKRIKRLSVLKLEEIPEDWPGDPTEFSPGWWIKDPNNPEILYVGPYATKRETTEGWVDYDGEEYCGPKKGLENFWRNHDEE